MKLRPPTPGELGSAAHLVLAECLRKNCEASKYLDKIVTVKDGVHAKLSPSKAHQWIKCHGSVDYKAKAAPAREPVKVRIPKEVVASVSTALEILVPILCETTLFGVEEDLKISATKEGGSVDVWAYLKHTFTLYVWDYKSGRGHVDAKENPQMRTYATALIKRFPECKKVVLGIIQPANDNPLSFEEITPAELNEWESLVLFSAAFDIRMGCTQRTAGDHCEYCKKAGDCPTLAKYSADTARMIFKDFITPGAGKTPDDECLSPKDIVGILSNIHAAEAFFKAVRARALHILMTNPKSLPELKLVEGQTRRKWTDEDAAIAALVKAGLKMSDIAPPKLIGITDVASLLPPKKREAIVSPLTTKPRGKPTVTTADDPRPSIHVDAKDAFADDINEDSP